MNREIKFRVWDNYLKSYKDNYENRENDSGEFYLPPKMLFLESLKSLQKDSDRFTIEQFTGLKDKNDKEIYEGDIIRRIYSCKYYIGRDIRNGVDCGAKFSECEKEFYSIYEVLWFNGTYEVNCSEYSILVNGWAVKFIFDNSHLERSAPLYGVGEIKPLGLPFETENFGAYGIVANEHEVIGNIHENPELLK